jgi:hypothetical protein
MDHFGGHVIESARTQFGPLAFACQNGLTGNHGVRLISGVPMFSHMDRFRRANEQAGSMRFRINMQETNFRRIFPEIGKNFVPFEIGHIFENRPIARRWRWLGCLRTNVAQGRERQRQKDRKREFCFHEGSIDPTFRFHKESYATVAGIGDAGVPVRGPGSAIPATTKATN